MGYFSNLAITYTPYDCDHSYTPPEKQLLWRLEDLQDRLLELRTHGCKDDGACLSDSDLRYVLPGQFRSVPDVLKAIDLVTVDLAERYGIYLQEAPVAEEPPEVDEITDMQISILDILSLQTCREYLQAA